MALHRGPSALSPVIFPAGPSDAEALAHVHVTAWRETYRGMLPDAFLARMSEAGFARRFARELAGPAGALTFAAAAARQGLVGYAQAGPSRRAVEGEGEIATLYVLSAWQGRGVGRDLLGAAVRALTAQGARSLMISVLRENSRARRFYEHLGGRAEAPRQERGPGGALVHEVAYVWPDIRTLTG